MASTSRGVGTLRACRSQLSATAMFSSTSSITPASSALSRSRAFSSLSRNLAAPVKGGSTQRTKQTSGFGKKNKEKFIRRGAEMKPVVLDQLEFRNQNQPSNLPRLIDVEVNRSLRHVPIAFESGKNSLQKTFGLPRSVSGELVHMEQPFAIIRDVTLSSFERMDKAAQSSSADSRYVLTGPSGTGKSVTLVQTVEYCARQGWFVIYVPRAIDWVNSTTAFQYDARSQTFVQPTLARDLLRQIAAFNTEALSLLTVPSHVVFDRTTIPEGSPLRELVEVGCNDPTTATTVLRTTLEILGAQTSVPVLLAVDDFQALYGKSLYRDPQFNYVQARYLSVPRLVLEYASGKSAFARGAVVGALSNTNLEFQVPVELQDALGQTPQKSSLLWKKRNEEYADYAKGLVPIEVPGQLSVQEGAAMVEVWQQNSSFHSDLNDSVFLAKLAETGGNPREFLRRGYLASLVTW